MKNGKRRDDALVDDPGDVAGLSDDHSQSLEVRGSRRLEPAHRVRMIRNALGLSQKKFSVQFQIPLGTLRDWEQGRKEPEAAARAYLMVIGRNPAAVAEALHTAL